MVYKKEYTNKQYHKFLETPFSSSYGCDEDKVIHYYLRNHPPIVSNFGLNYNNLKNTYIPYVKKHLGKGAYTIFLGLQLRGAEGPTGGLGWINHEARYGSPYNQLNQDVAYIKQLLNSKAWGVNHWAPETGSCTLEKDAYTTFSHLHKGDTGMYYMQATLAGNACVWNHAWSMTQYFGNPYDVIIDMIKACGGKPFAGLNDGGSGTGGNSGSGADETIKLPKAVYLNNSEFSVLGVHFRRYRNWLFIKYPFNVSGIGDGGSGGGSDAKGSSEDLYKKVLKVFNATHGRGLAYQMWRPAGDPDKTGWSDCSGMVGWLFHTIYPSLWNNGRLNTGTILAFAKRKNAVVWHGSQAELIKHMDVVKHGDYIVMGNEPTCGAGIYSHVVWCYEGDGANAKICSMEPAGWLKHPLHYFLKNWWVPVSEHPYMYVCRLK